MKILIVNTSDIDGGAARAAYRLHKSLLNQGIDSYMLVQNKSSDEYRVISQTSKLQRGMNALRPTLDGLPLLFYKNRSKTVFSPAWLPFINTVKKINDINPDIVHLHGICGGMLKIENLVNIKAPIVWSLHDMWAFTGGCRYSEGCIEYEKRCGNCKVLGSIKEHDLSRKIFNRKQKAFSKINNMTIVGLSQWLNKLAKKSTLLKNKKHITLPNPIDTNIFKPFDKEKSKELWSLPKNKKLVLFGAMGATSDPRKGFNELKKALSKLEENEIELVVFGSSKPKESQNFGFKTHYLGALSDNVSLVALYNAVDIVVIPSLEENLSNVIMESLACGTPVVGFDIGGNSDMIEHKKSGYLAKEYDADDLSNGIEWILKNKNYNNFCVNAREKVLKEFDSVVVAKKYIELYKRVLIDK